MSNNDTLLYGDSPLACAWLAASLEKKLSKQQYLKTSILDSTRAIEISSAYNDSETNQLVTNSGSESQFQFVSQAPNPDASSKDRNEKEPIALRISGQLLYGVVKIYSRKTKYLYDEVSLALIQLKSAFAVSKSITVPIEKTVITSIDNITLRDTVTEMNILYNTDSFNINKVFGITEGEDESRRGTQLWTQAPPNSQSQTGFEDISVGRNDNTTNNELTNVEFDYDFDVPADYDNNTNGNSDQDDVGADIANQSIDALSRRAVLPADDLDGVDDIELDLNLKEPEMEKTTEIPGISDFQISAIDNMDLEFTMDETTNGVEEDDVEVEESDNNEEEQLPVKRKRTRRFNKKSYKNDNVIRTQRKKITVDEVRELSTEQLRTNQREYPQNLRSTQTFNSKFEDKLFNDLLNDFEPKFLKDIGYNWNSLKRKRSQLQLNGTNTDISVDDHGIEVSANHVEENEEVERDPTRDVEVQPQDDGVTNNDILPELDAHDVDFDFDVPDEESYRPQEQPVSEHSSDDDREEKDFEENEEENGDFDNYDDIDNRNKATIEVANELRNEFKDVGKAHVSFDSLVDACKLSNNTKNNVTRTFFELLVLGTSNSVKIEQDRLFGEITISSKPSLFEQFI